MGIKWNVTVPEFRIGVDQCRYPAIVQIPAFIIYGYIIISLYRILFFPNTPHVFNDTNLLSQAVQMAVVW